MTYTRTDEREIPLRISALDRRLTGFEMVVTSSNHAAVENVSGALPGMDALAEQWRSEAQYFRRPAQMVATKWAQHPDPQGRPRRRVEPWGLTAAILGRRSYLGVFAEGLGLYGGRAAVGSGSLRETLAAGAPLTEWDEAKRTFAAAATAVENAVQARQQAVQRLRDRDRLHTYEGQLRSTVAKLREARPAATHKVQHAVQKAQTAATASATADAEMQRSAKDQPGWWARQLRTKAAARWAETNAASAGRGVGSGRVCPSPGTGGQRPRSTDDIDRQDRQALTHTGRTARARRGGRAGGRDRYGPLLGSRC